MATPEMSGRFAQSVAHPDEHEHGTASERKRQGDGEVVEHAAFLREFEFRDARCRAFQGRATIVAKSVGCTWLDSVRVPSAMIAAMATQAQVMSFVASCFPVGRSRERAASGAGVRAGD
jgi:hypothetical protein